MEIILNNGSLAPQPTSLVTYVGEFQVPSIQSTTINEYTAMTIPAFWRAVRFITSGMAGLPLSVYRKDGETRTKIEHPLNKLMSRKPNGICSPFVLFETWFHHALVWGNGYLWVKRNAARKVERLMNINPECVTPFLYHDDETGESSKWFYVEAKQPFVLANDDVLHVHPLGFDALQGYPLVSMMRDSLEVGKYAEGHTNNYFKNGTVLRGAIEVPGNLTDAQLQTMQNSLASFKGGATTTSDYMILQANAKLNNTTIPNETSQLVETRKFTIIDIARMLGVPPHVVYELDQNKYANIEQMSLDVVKYSLKEWIDKAEQQFTTKLLTEGEQDGGHFVRYNVDGLLRGDFASRTTNVTALVNNGLATPNWGAAVLDLPPLGPDGDKLRVPVAVSQPLNPTADEPRQTPPEAAPDAAESPQAGEGEQNAAKADAVSFAAVIEPLLSDACARVEAKTAKAFERRDGQADAELLPWANVFAEQQAQFVVTSLAPICAAALALGFDIDSQKVSARYATEVKRFASTKTKRELIEIVKEVMNGN